MNGPGVSDTIQASFDTREDESPRRRVYLAGPMRGIPEYNFPAFFTAEADLGLKGWDVFNPARYDAEVKGFAWHGLTGNENLADLGFDLREALAVDLAWITRHAESVAVLPGWEASKGARAEVATALALGLRVFTYPDGNTVTRLPYLPLDSADVREYMNSIGEQLGKLARSVRNPFSGVMQRGIDDGNGMTFTPAPGEVIIPLDGARTDGGEVRVTSETGGAKGQKPEQYHAIPVGPLRELAEHYGKGAAKYGDPHNFRKGYPWSSSFSAAMRHAWAFWGGEDIDPETGSKHVIAWAWHALALASFMDEHPGFDDRVKVAS